MSNTMDTIMGSETIVISVLISTEEAILIRTTVHLITDHDPYYMNRTRYTASKTRVRKSTQRSETTRGYPTVKSASEKREYSCVLRDECIP